MSAGGDYNMLLGSNGEYAYSGLTANAGAGIGLVAEWHEMMEYTWVWGCSKSDLLKWMLIGL